MKSAILPSWSRITTAVGEAPTSVALDLQVELLRFDVALELRDLVLKLEPELRAVVLVLRQLPFELVQFELGGDVSSSRIASPGSRNAPGRRSRRRTRASTGLAHPQILK